MGGRQWGSLDDVGVARHLVSSILPTQNTRSPLAPLTIVLLSLTCHVPRRMPACACVCVCVARARRWESGLDDRTWSSVGVRPGASHVVCDRPWTAAALEGWDGHGEDLAGRLLLLAAHLELQMVMECAS